MTLQELFKNAIGTYPLVTKTSLTQQAQVWEKERMRLKRLVYFKQTLESQEKKQLELLPKLLDEILPSLLQHVLNEPQNLYALLASCEAIAPQKRVELWRLHLQTRLKHVEEPLALLIQFGISTPILFVGSILYLLGRKITSDTLLHSGLFHLVYMLMTPEELAEAYALLRETQNVSCQDELDLLLKKIEFVACEPLQPFTSQRFTGINLKGERKPDNTLKQIEIDIPKPDHVTASLDQLNNIHQLFGHEFFFDALYAYSLNKTEALSAFLVSILIKMTDEEIYKLYATVINQKSEEQRLNYFGALNDLLPPDRLYQHLDSSVRWFILAANPKLLEVLTPLQKKHMLKEPITASNIKYVALASQHECFKANFEPLYLKMFTFLLSDCSSIDYNLGDEDPIVNALSHYPPTQTLCELQARALKNGLLEHLIEPLTLEAFQQIENTYNAFKTQSTFLHLLHDHLDYPQGTYTLHRMILTELFKQNPHFDVGETLEIFYQNSNYFRYSQAELLNAKSRTLIECLIEEKNPKLHEHLIKALHTECHNPNWMNGHIADTPILHLALLKNNATLFHHFLPAHLNENERNLKLDIFNDRMFKETGDNLVTFVANNNPEALPLLLSYYPKKKLLKTLNDRDLQGYTVLHQIFENVAALDKIFHHLSYEERLYACQEETEYQDTLLHLAVNHPKSLQLILKAIPSPQRLSLLLKKNGEHESPLLLTTKCPKALGIEPLQSMLESLSNKAIVRLAKERISHGKTIVHCFAKNDKALELLFKSIPQKKWPSLVYRQDKNQDTPLHLGVNNPRAVELFLKALNPSDKRFLLGVKNKGGNTPLHLAIRFPKSLKKLLEAISLDAFCQLLLQKNNNGETLLHLATAYHTSLSMQLLLDKIPPQQRFSMLVQPNHCGNTVLHELVEKGDMLKAVLASLSDEEITKALLTKNKKNETLLALALSFNDTKSAIFELIPPELRPTSLPEQPRRTILQRRMTKWSFDDTLIDDQHIEFYVQNPSLRLFFSPSEKNPNNEALDLEKKLTV